MKKTLAFAAVLAASLALAGGARAADPVTPQHAAEHQAKHGTPQPEASAPAESAYGTPHSEDETTGATKHDAAPLAATTRKNHWH